ncbi:MAG TPA: hypothetical protein VMT80_01005 [Candidatus Paceibacterota bacterium]|nr:hypothetical protein [Candidatus Paceibacterota bacterium]
MSEKFPSSPETPNEMESYALEQDRKKLEKLRSISPEAAEIIERIKDPSLPRETFLDEIERFNALTSGEAAGRYEDLFVNVSKERWARVKIFENGRITLSGSSHEA